MLKNQKWMKYAPKILTEWRQMKDEGKKVERFRKKCEQIAAWSETEDCETEALETFRQMKQAPVQKDYPYEEPSLYEEIERTSEGNESVSWREKLSETELRDKIAGAWTGRISGCLLGKPFECLRTDAITEMKSRNRHSAK